MELLERLEQKEKRRKQNITRAWGFIYSTAPCIICLMLLLFGILYVSGSHEIYFGEDSLYWNVSRLKSSDGLFGFGYTAAIPTALWMRIFGDSRMAFVTGLIVIYIFPSVFFIYRLAKKLTASPKLWTFICILMLPLLMWSALRGMADIGGVAVALCVFDLYYDKENVHSVWYRYAVMGALLIFILVFGAYYVFFSVSFLTMLLADAIIMRHNRLNTVITLAVIAAAVTAAFIFVPVESIAQAFSELHADYRFNVGAGIIGILRCFGLVIVLSAVAVPFLSGKRDFRPIMVWIEIVVCMLMLSVVELHERQNMLLYIPAFALMLMFLSRNIKRNVKIAVYAAAAVSVIAVMTPSGGIFPILPDISFKPPQSMVADDILTARNSLDNMVEQGKICGILADSKLINAEILQNAPMSLNEYETRSGSYISQLGDDADAVYRCDYILSASPAQTQLAPDNALIITEAVRSFDNYADIAEVYMEIPEFIYSVGGVQLKLYKRLQEPDYIRIRDYKMRLSQN